MWPPAIGMPASAHTALPPASTRPITSTGNCAIGIATIASAMIGVPPIA